MITLKNVLLINALSSGATGLLLLAAPDALSQLFDVSGHAPFWVTGLFLVVFAALVYYASSRKTLGRSLVKVIIYLDLLWVLGSVLLVWLQGTTISWWGNGLILGVALWVAAMAYLQQAGLRRFSASAA